VNECTVGAFPDSPCPFGGPEGGYDVRDGSSRGQTVRRWEREGSMSLGQGGGGYGVRVLGAAAIVAAMGSRRARGGWVREGSGRGKVGG
jgi:hypothetical protein